MAEGFRWEGQQWEVLQHTDQIVGQSRVLLGDKQRAGRWHWHRRQACPRTSWSRKSQSMRAKDHWDSWARHCSAMRGSSQSQTSTGGFRSLRAVGWHLALVLVRSFSTPVGQHLFAGPFCDERSIQSSHNKAKTRVKEADQVAAQTSQGGRFGFGLCHP